ncbi:MAG: hypothetical protein AB7I48_17600 [Planctomycetaceae bacterium]
MAAANGAFLAVARAAGLTALLILANGSRAGAAEPYTLSEPPTDARVKAVNMQVAISGKVITSAGGGKELSHELNAAAEYRFRERRLSGAGRDAEAYRSLRQYDGAAVRTSISKEVSTQSLPRELSLIAVQGERWGTMKYSPDHLLTREQLDLLDVPGDPLAIVALLPARAVEVDETWDVPDWAVQMLTTLEAASSAKMTAKLTGVSNGAARIEFNGAADGARLGAITKVELSGHLLFDLGRSLIKSVELTHTEKGAVGTVTPGIDSQVRVMIARSLSETAETLTDERANSLPLEPPADRMPLRFDAPSWGVSLVHGRGWHVFKAIFDTDPQVVILRLVDQGTLVCQCNFSPVPDAAPGEHTPLEDYENSIRQSLGAQFGAIVSRDTIPSEDGRKIFRVTTQGKYTLPEGEETKDYPMSWIYYLCVAPTGRQVSFVFAVEPSMKELLAGQDRQIVESLQFTPPVR